MVKLNADMKAGTDAATVTDVQVNHVSQTIAKPNVIRRPLSMDDFKDGFKYEAWVGYEWTEVEYGKNGFSKSQLKDAIERRLVRSLDGDRRVLPMCKNWQYIAD